MSNEANPRKPVLVVGVGGCGINLVKYLAGKGLESVDLAVADRDTGALAASGVEEKILLDCGTDDIEGQLESLLAERPDLVFVVGGMGGATGGSFAPVIGRFTKDKGICTVGLAVAPFLFEGAGRSEKARTHTDDFENATSNIFVTSNESTDKNLDVTQAFKETDSRIARPIELINDIISYKNYISLDINDVVNVLYEPSAIIAEGEATGEKRLENALNTAFRKADIGKIKKILINIFFSANSDNPLQAEELGQLNNLLATLGDDVETVWGVGTDDSLGDRVKAVIIAAPAEE